MRWVYHPSFKMCRTSNLKNGRKDLLDANPGVLPLELINTDDMTNFAGLASADVTSSTDKLKNFAL